MKTKENFVDLSEFHVESCHGFENMVVISGTADRKFVWGYVHQRTDFLKQ